MKTKFLSLAMIALMATISISCSKDEAAAPTTQNPIVADGFTWSVNGGAIKTATVAQYNRQSNGGREVYIIASDNTGTAFELGVSNNGVPGTYNTQPGNGNGNFLLYVNAPSDQTFTASSITITAFANNKISGTFTATVGVGGAGAVTSVTGTFNNIGL